MTKGHAGSYLLIAAGVGGMVVALIVGILVWRAILR